MIELLLLLQNYSPDDAPSFTEQNGKHHAIQCNPCIGYTTHHEINEFICIRSITKENAKDMHLS